MTEDADIADPPRPDFSNAPVMPATMPDFTPVPLHPVTRAFYPYALLSSAWFWPLVGAISALLSRFEGLEFGLWPGLSLAIALLALPAMVFAVLDARRRGWALREHDLISRSGVFWQRTAILPFARIQHVETLNGPLERVFGLMRLRCYTAGGSAADLALKGLSAAEARRVRQYLLEQIRDGVVRPGRITGDAASRPGDDGPCAHAAGADDRQP